MTIKAIKQEISGLLIIDKPLGFSSNQALSKIKWLFNPKKVGHTGTLDPLATGLLPVCLGEATKFSSYLFDANKTYEAKIKLGFTSSTGDAEGALTDLNIDSFPNKAAVINELKNFEGAIEQIPPMHSALKHDGKPLYQYARKGIEIPRKKRKVIIFSIKFYLSKHSFPKLDYKILAPRISDQKVFVADITKAQRILNWTPIVTTHDGLRRMIGWVDSEIIKK